MSETTTRARRLLDQLLQYHWYHETKPDYDEYLKILDAYKKKQKKNKPSG